MCGSRVPHPGMSCVYGSAYEVYCCHPVCSIKWVGCCDVCVIEKTTLMSTTQCCAILSAAARFRWKEQQCAIRGPWNGAAHKP